MTREETHNQVVAVLFSDDVRTDSGRAFGREFRARIPDARVIYVDPRIAAGMSDEVLKAVDEAQTVVAAVYVIPTAGKSAIRWRWPTPPAFCCSSCSIMLPERPLSSRWGIRIWPATFPRSRIICVHFRTRAFRKWRRSKALFGEIPIRGSSACHHSKHCAARRWPRTSGAGRQRRFFPCAELNRKSSECSALGFATLVSLLLPACSVNVKKEAERGRQAGRYRHSGRRHPRK